MASLRKARADHCYSSRVGLAADRTGGFYRQLTLTLRVNEEIPLEDLIAHLDSVGYERREPVEMVGDYSLRGGILDIFPAEIRSRSASSFSAI